MANYDSERYMTTNTYFLFVRVYGPTTAMTEDAYTTNQYAYVRGFTGLTEQECLDSRSSAGGRWVPCETGSTVSHYVYPLPMACEPVNLGADEKAKVYARIEVYWPGMPQKGIFYSNTVMLCGYGENGTDDRYTRYGTDPCMVASIRGTSPLHTQRYISYGDAERTLRRISPDWPLPNYNKSENENREIIVDGATTGTLFYNQFVSSSTKIASSVFSSKTTTDNLKLIVHVGFKGSGVTCPSERSSYYCNCGSEYEETDCPEDSCPTDCNGVCNCDSETHCYNDFTGCKKDCSSHACQYDETDVCGCFTADDSPECDEDLSPYDSCNYVPLRCLSSNNKTNDDCSFYVTDLNIPVTAATIRLEGQLTTSGSGWHNICYLSSSSTRNNGTYMRFTTYGSASGYVRGIVCADSVLPSYKTITGLKYNEDIDITIGNNWLYDNNTSSYLYSADTSTNVNSVIGRFFAIKGVNFKTYRVRVYNGESVALDLIPVKGECVKGSNEFPTKYGLYDQISGKFHGIVGNASSTGITACVPAGYNEGDVIETDCLYGNGSDIYWTHPGILSSVTVNNLKLRFEGVIPYSGSNQTLFATYSGTSTGSSYMRVTVNTYGYVNSTRKDTDWRLSYSGSSKTNATITGVSGQSYNTDIDVTFGNRYVYDNNNGKYVYSAATQNSTSQFQSMLRINFGKIRFYRLRVYNNDTMIADYKPVAIVKNGVFEPGIKETISGYNVPFLSPSINYCDIPISGSPITSGYLLKCMNGSAIHYQHTYNQGETIDRSVITAPSKVGYTFTGWNPAIPTTMPGEDFTTEAQFSINSHTITYYLKDGEHGSTSYVQYTSQTYNYGATIVPPTITPGSGYEFSGWSLSGNTTMPDSDLNSYGDVHVYVPSYTITFYSGTTSWGSTPSCNKIGEAQYKSGQTISYPTVSAYCRSAYYGGWKLSCTGGTNAPSTMPANNVNAYYVLGWDTYEIGWYVRTGTTGSYSLYNAETLEYGDVINGDDLSSSAPSGYYWAGWGTHPSTMPCEDISVYGQFLPESVPAYSVTYYADGEYYAVQNGCTVGYPIDGQTLPDGSSSCKTWSDWSYSDSGLPNSMPSNNASAFTVSTPIYHTLGLYVHHVNGSYEMVDSYTYTFRDPIPVIGEMSDTDQYTYSPYAWNEPASSMPCEDLSAITEESYKVYTATFYMADGTVWSTVTGHSGDSITAPNTYSKTGYDVSWPSFQSTFTNSDISVYAVETIRSHTVYWVVTGTTWRTDTYNYGASILERTPPVGYYWETSAPSTMPDADVYIYAVAQGCTCDGDGDVPCDTCAGESFQEYTMDVYVTFRNETDYDTSEDLGVDVTIGSPINQSFSFTCTQSLAQYEEFEAADAFSYDMSLEGTTVSVNPTSTYGHTILYYSHNVILDHNSTGIYITAVVS